MGKEISPSYEDVHVYIHFLPSFHSARPSIILGQVTEQANSGIMQPSLTHGYDILLFARHSSPSAQVCAASSYVSASLVFDFVMW